MTTRTLAISYALAVGTACPLAYGLGKVCLVPALHPLSNGPRRACVGCVRSPSHPRRLRQRKRGVKPQTKSEAGCCFFYVKITYNTTPIFSGSVHFLHHSAAWSSCGDKNDGGGGGYDASMP